MEGGWHTEIYFFSSTSRTESANAFKKWNNGRSVDISSFLHEKIMREKKCTVITCLFDEVACFLTKWRRTRNVKEGSERTQREGWGRGTE